jgi:putative Ca2+/H+ antiporter (TMEM165/GDT1 family)
MASLPSPPVHGRSFGRFDEITGTTLGMMMVNIPPVFLAELATKWIPFKAVRIVSAIIYAILGLLTLSGYSPHRVRV